MAAAGALRLGWEAGRAPGPADLEAVRALAGLVAAFRPDAVHLHSAKAGLAGRLAVRGRLPTLFQPHGWSWLACRGAMAMAARAWERWAARRTSLLVCVGEGEEAAARAAGVRGRLAVVRNGVDLRRFRPAGEAERAAARRALGVPERARLAVCVGRITRQKGQDRLLAAWAEVRAACPSALLALVGDGDLRDRLRARGVPGVLFPGAADDVRPWYAAADVAVLPSRWEGLPLAALEAMATGRSLVATAIPGLCEVVAADTGATVVPGDTTGLARALARRLADPALARREGEAAARHAEGYDLAATLDALAALTLRAAYPPRKTSAERGLAGHCHTPCGQ
ncbi:glycosyltransferase involved in cell wall biosynthesis [Thermocatellispora tengchongensis]|uniref:Glycosyltransferase involved in cell wall biosynthesis n=1 Tax=Thermocatellispora tengchongensis TaxID=1073253 RepID=A0A840PBJ1_9ACTN|nr:glycosyltransferase involved in cell wall biosynthesis [Thermocatellispora tengchongensis]